MKLLKECPAYIRRDYPQEAHKWAEFRAEVIGFTAIASILSRGYYISVETSDCDVQTVAEYLED